MKPQESFWWELGDTEGVILVDGRTATRVQMPIRKTQWPDPKLVKMWAGDDVLLYLVAYFRSSCCSGAWSPTSCAVLSHSAQTEPYRVGVKSVWAVNLLEKMVYSDHGVSALHHPDTGQVCSLRAFLKFLSDVELEEVGGGWQMEKSVGEAHSVPTR